MFQSCVFSFLVVSSRGKIRLVEAQGGDICVCPLSFEDTLLNTVIGIPSVMLKFMPFPTKVDWIIKMSKSVARKVGTEFLLA